MSDPFIGELRWVGFSFAPRGWAMCDGAIMQISQNQPLYSLLGTAYGGDGRQTFGLPDLRGRVAAHVDPVVGFVMGRTGGEAAHVLTQQEMPAPHTHTAQGAYNGASANEAANAVLASSTVNLYGKPAVQTPINSNTVSVAGGQAHDNMSPFQVLTCCIALQGAYPSRN